MRASIDRVVRYMAYASRVLLNENRKSRTAPSPQSPRTAAPTAARIISRSTVSLSLVSSVTAVTVVIVPPAM